MEANHLLFISTTVNDFNNQLKDKLVFNKDGRLIGESASIGENSGAYRSCSTMVNGEAVIFGGNHDEPININRQVNIMNLKNIFFFQENVFINKNIIMKSFWLFDFEIFKLKITCHFS